jgi:hypothetical protein
MYSDWTRERIAPSTHEDWIRLTTTLAIRDLTVDENLRFFGSMYGLAGREISDRVAEEKQRFDWRISWTDAALGLVSKEESLSPAHLFTNPNCSFWMSRQAVWIPWVGAISGRSLTDFLPMT